MKIKNLCRTLCATIICLIIAFSFTACENSNNVANDVNTITENTENVENANIVVNLTTNNSTTTSGDALVITTNYNDDLFLQNDAKVYNKNLAVLSYALAMSAQKDVRVQSGTMSTNFFNNLGFSNNYTTPYYRQTPTEDGIAFSFAHKQIRNNNESFDLVAVVIRGFDYALEWVSNFTVGESGNHKGLNDSADKVYNELKNYINANSYSNVKLWLTGYSRGGGVSNVLASKVMQKNELNIRQKNFFVYTFEAPRGLCTENAIPYKNVFNIINSADIVTQIVPEKLGLYRCGVDIDLYVNDLKNVVCGINPKIELVDFISKKGYYSNPKEFVAYIIKEFTKKKSGLSLNLTYNYVNISTRSNFVKNAQEELIDIIKIALQTDRATLLKLKNNFSSLQGLDYLTLLTKDGLFNFVAPVLKESNPNLTDNEIYAVTEFVRNIVLSHKDEVLDIYTNSMTNLTFLTSMHCIDVNYALLENYNG